MTQGQKGSPRSLDETDRRELVDLLYASLPQFVASTGIATLGGATIAAVGRDLVDAAIAAALGVIGLARIGSLLHYPRGRSLTAAEVRRWERIYGAGAALFAAALGALAWRALDRDDAPGAWLSLGLAVGYCVGLMSRAAVCPWIVMLATAVLFAPILVGGLMRPEPAYQVGAAILVPFWLTVRESARHLSGAFIERLEAKRALAHQAEHDALTGLLNRAGFLARLGAALEQAGSRPFALIAIDLDGFKRVNDRLGHPVGDAVLVEVGMRLRRCLAPDDVAGRLGGDEFMILTRADGGVPAAADRAERVIAALSDPYPVAEPQRIGASAGLASSEDWREALDAAALLERVDEALYAAKRGGRGRWCAARPGGAVDGPVPWMGPRRGGPRACAGARSSRPDPNAGL
ncbi:diguanylate cyclase [Methylobacterium sp. 4-46]|uniref:GGDEF domain-containing protein n=1 Tax=unclassified Methylobacterium TaxID=2615210 RepID=UPI000152EA7C|nr:MULTISPECIES: GGDEF domain-containing protein [Methylobacterium]ACA18834.1 diguanylate cyclase [Methylobacterium sp. 4-46]WFT78060.1 GGDEF domain-containing protein [Methylobacterium nodulans]